MPLVFSKRTFSESTNGRMIPVIQTGSPGDLVHTVQVTGTDALEVVQLWAVNRATSTATTGNASVVLEYGTTATTHLISGLLGQQGPEQIVSDLILSATTTTIRAYATASGRISIVGYVVRAT